MELGAHPALIGFEGKPLSSKDPMTHTETAERLGFQTIVPMTISSSLGRGLMVPKQWPLYPSLEWPGVILEEPGKLSTPGRRPQQSGLPSCYAPATSEPGMV